MNPVKIAILGSRGIPNHYGGFEQLAQYLADGLSESGWSVTVYNSHRHPFREKKWNQVDIVHCYDPEHLIGTAGQFIYDLNCIRHARKQKYDVILFLGYTSSSVWHRWFPGNTVIISNMDGMEWKRSKYSKPVQRFLQVAEKLAVKHSHFLIADSVAIQNYLDKKFGKPSRYIAYGAELKPDTSINEKYLAMFGLESGRFHMLMARMEPENNIAMVLEGFHRSKTNMKFLVVGNTGNAYGRMLMKRYDSDKRIIFAGAIFESFYTHILRRSCSLYFHGHSVGGTNPSLLEAMADRAIIAAHTNPFNRAVLEDDGYYFDSADEVTVLIDASSDPETENQWRTNNREKIRTRYNWPMIVEAYGTFIRECLDQTKS